MQKIRFRKPLIVMRSPAAGGPYYHAMINGQWIHGDQVAVENRYIDAKRAHRNTLRKASRARASVLN